MPWSINLMCRISSELMTITGISLVYIVILSVWKYEKKHSSCNLLSALVKMYDLFKLQKFTAQFNQCASCTLFSVEVGLCRVHIRQSRYDKAKVVKKCTGTLSGITDFIAKAICVVPYIELNFPTYTGTFFMITDGVRIHWEGHLKQLLRETGNCTGRVFVEYSGSPNYCHHVTIILKPKI